MKKRLIIFALACLIIGGFSRNDILASGSHDFILDFDSVTTDSETFISNNFFMQSGFSDIETNAESEDFSEETINLIPFCGNGVVENEEFCDESNFEGKTCSDFGYSGGDLLCENQCTFIRSSECSNENQEESEEEEKGNGGNRNEKMRENHNAASWALQPEEKMKEKEKADKKTEQEKIFPKSQKEHLTDREFLEKTDVLPETREENQYPKEEYQSTPQKIGRNNLYNPFPKSRENGIDAHGREKISKNQSDEKFSKNIPFGRKTEIGSVKTHENSDTGISLQKSLKIFFVLFPILISHIFLLRKIAEKRKKKYRKKRSISPKK